MNLVHRLRSCAVCGLISIFIILCTAAASADTAAASDAELEAMKAALVGAEEVALDMGTYTADQCSTSLLSEEEIAAQIVEYNMRVAQYLTSDNPCYESYQLQNEFLLREAYVTEVTYQVDGAVMDCMIQSITLNETGDYAVIGAVLVAYNKWVDAIGNGNYEITCCANKLHIIADLEKIDGDWKVQGYEEMNCIETWTPGDVVAGAASTDYMEAQNLACSTYSDFQSALNAANKIDFADICPLETE